jgi:NADH-quinone oxidoreductase subunit J
VIDATEILIGLLVFVALWTVQTSILRAAIGLAATSVVLTLIIFHMGAPLAAVFELSVCAGLITVVFVSTISMTRPQNEAEERREKKIRSLRFHPGFLVSALVGLVLWASGYVLEVAAPAGPLASVRDVLWNVRRLDLLGQIIIMFVGVFGVVILFKEQRREKEPGR